MEKPRTMKLEYQEPGCLENSQVDVVVNDCKLSWIILAIFVNGINANKTEIYSNQYTYACISVLTLMGICEAILFMMWSLWIRQRSI